MYYEEKVVNGIMCYRTFPTGDWKPFSLEQMAVELLKAKEALIDKRESSQRYCDCSSRGWK